MAYKRELEAVWRQISRAGESRRPESLRGRDVVTLFGRAFVQTKDLRFRDAIYALFDHGIINEKFRFTRWQSPEHKKRNENMSAIMVKIIAELVSSGKSVHRACAECAAIVGHQAASFDAAVKDLERLYAKHGQNV
jgi:hypothetical protein